MGRPVQIVYGIALLFSITYCVREIHVADGTHICLDREHGPGEGPDYEPMHPLTPSSPGSPERPLEPEGPVVSSQSSEDLSDQHSDGNTVGKQDTSK